ncbi:MAG: hypothetical protein ACFFDN_20805 [Candidatus Hodarchaeota archaeon]
MDEIDWKALKERIPDREHVQEIIDFHRLRREWDNFGKPKIIDPDPWPFCYIPPIWDMVIDQAMEKRAEELVKDKSPHILVRHFETRIMIVEDLVKNGKLDPELGEKAIMHYKAHLETLGSIP